MWSLHPSAFDQQQLVSIPTFARVAAPVSVSVPVPVLSAPLSSAAPSAIEPSTPIAIPTYAGVQTPILSVAQPIVQSAQPAFTTTIIQPTIQPVLSYAQPQLQQSIAMQPIMQAESSLTAVPSVSQAVAVPGPFEYLGPQAPLRPIDPANPPAPIVAMPVAPKLGVTLAPPNADQQTVAQIALGSGGLTQPAQLAAIQPATQPAWAYAQPQLQQPFVTQPTLANVPSLEQTGALGSIGLNQQQFGQLPSVALGSAVGQQLQQMDPQQLAQQQQQISQQQQGQLIAQQPQQWTADQFAQPIGQPQQMAA